MRPFGSHTHQPRSGGRLTGVTRVSMQRPGSVNFVSEQGSWPPHACLCQLVGTYPTSSRALTSSSALASSGRLSTNRTRPRSALANELTTASSATCQRYAASADPRARTGGGRGSVRDARTPAMGVPLRPMGGLVEPRAVVVARGAGSVPRSAISSGPLIAPDPRGPRPPHLGNGAIGSSRSHGRGSFGAAVPAGGRGGNVTRTSSPPAWGVRVTRVARCAVVIALTMASPRP